MPEYLLPDLPISNFCTSWPRVTQNIYSCAIAEDESSLYLLAHLCPHLEEMQLLFTAHLQPSWANTKDLQRHWVHLRLCPEWTFFTDAAHGEGRCSSQPPYGEGKGGQLLDVSRHLTSCCLPQQAPTHSIQFSLDKLLRPFYSWHEEESWSVLNCKFADWKVKSNFRCSKSCVTFFWNIQTETWRWLAKWTNRQCISFSILFCFLSLWVMLPDNVFVIWFGCVMRELIHVSEAYLAGGNEEGHTFNLSPHPTPTQYHS